MGGFVGCEPEHVPDFLLRGDRVVIEIVGGDVDDGFPLFVLGLVGALPSDEYVGRSGHDGVHDLLWRTACVFDELEVVQSRDVPDEVVLEVGGVGAFDSALAGVGVVAFVLEAEVAKPVGHEDLDL